MLRGSKPGERRGGRQRGTPNRRTILRDRILSIGLDHPTASQHAFLLELVNDRQLPADTLMAVAPRCFPPKRSRSSRAGRPRALAGARTSAAQEALAAECSAATSKVAQTPAVVPAVRDWAPQALDALFGVVQNAAAYAKARRIAALKIAEFLLPKAAKKAKVVPDEYGFSVNLNLASAYRAIQRELGAVVQSRARKIPANAEKIKKLQARSDAIARRFQFPCPTKYGEREADKDRDRLMELAELRVNGSVLTEAQMAEEAHLLGRLTVLSASPESIARRRRAALEDAERRFKHWRLFGHVYAAPLSPKDQHELKRLQWYYPGPSRNLSDLDDQGLEPYRDNPFGDEFQAPDGNFYPRQSTLPPASAADRRKWLEQLGKIERKELTPKEDAEDQQNPELISKARIRDLEERCVGGFQLTASEEEELCALRKRYPEFAAVMDLMDLRYLYHWRREVEIARTAGLNTLAMFEQADVVCLRFRDPAKFTTESDAQQYRRVRGEATEAASLKL